MLMVPFLGLTAAQPAMLSSGIKMMYTGNTVCELKLIMSSRLTTAGLTQLPARLTLACRRMDFSLKCAYAHGTSALRTHLINMSDKQIQLTWPCFKILKDKWKGKVSSNIKTCHEGIEHALYCCTVSSTKMMSQVCCMAFAYEVTDIPSLWYMLTKNSTLAMQHVTYSCQTVSDCEASSSFLQSCMLVPFVCMCLFLLPSCHACILPWLERAPLA